MCFDLQEKISTTMQTSPHTLLIDFGFLHGQSNCPYGLKYNSQVYYKQQEPKNRQKLSAKLKEQKVYLQVLKEKGNWAVFSCKPFHTILFVITVSNLVTTCSNILVMIFSHIEFISTEEQKTILFYLSDSHLPWPRISILQVFSSLCDKFVL